MSYFPQRAVYEVDPKPELTPAEEAAQGVFEPLLEPAEAHPQIP
jgi:hypothetical protein